MAFLYQDKHLDGPNMPIVTPNSPEGQERMRWDRPKSQGGMRCDGFEEYPKSMFRAGRPDHGNIKITESCSVGSAHEEARQYDDGWRPTQQAAIDLVKARDQEIAELAAERHYVERSMSPAAQREAAAVDEATVYHVPAIPETPIKRRGRPKKATVPA